MKIAVTLEEWFPVVDYFVPETDPCSFEISDISDEVVQEYNRAREAFVKASKALYAAAGKDPEEEVWGWQ